MQSATCANSRYQYGYAAPVPVTPAPITTPDTAIDVQYDVGRQEIVFPEGSGPSLVYNGDWVVMTIAGQTPVHHRVEDTSLFPTVKLSDIGIPQRGSAAMNFPALPVVPATPATTPPPPMLIPATMARYDQMFDDMDEVGKAESIVSDSFH